MNVMEKKLLNGGIIKVSDVMVENIISVPPNVLVSDAAEAMLKNSISSVVVKKDDKIIGIVTDKDFVRLAYHGGNPKGVAGLMSTNLITIPPSSDLFDAFKLMKKKNVRHLLVKENDKIVGIISQKDVIRGIAAMLLM
jgi:CBS domain-containing protein